MTRVGGLSVTTNVEGNSKVDKRQILILLFQYLTSDVHFSHRNFKESYDFSLKKNLVVRKTSIQGRYPLPFLCQDL